MKGTLITARLAEKNSLLHDDISQRIAQGVTLVEEFKGRRSGGRTRKLSHLSIPCPLMSGYDGIGFAKSSRS
jgi:hypothetical protein